MSIEIGNVIHAMATVFLGLFPTPGGTFLGQGNVGFAPFAPTPAPPNFSERLSAGRARLHLLQPIDFARGEGLVFVNLLNFQSGGPPTSEATRTVRTGEPPLQGPTTDIFVNTDEAAMPLDLAFMIVVLRFPQQSTRQA